MRKIFFLAVAVSLASSVCFAQQAPMPVEHESHSQMQTATAVGKIETIVPADSAKGTKAELVVVDENGNKTTFAVANTAVMHDTEMAAISLDKLAQGQKIKVRYHKTTEGTNEATSVMLLK